MSGEQRKKSFWNPSGLSQRNGGFVMGMGFSGMLVLFAWLVLQELR